MPLEIDILTGTEIPSKWEAVEEVADLTVIHRDNIKQDDQGCKQEKGGKKTHPDQSYLLLTIIWPKGDVWHDGIGQKETKKETEQVCIIIYPREQATKEQHQCDSYQFQ